MIVYHVVCDGDDGAKAECHKEVLVRDDPDPWLFEVTDWVEVDGVHYCPYCSELLKDK